MLANTLCALAVCQQKAVNITNCFFRKNPAKKLVSINI